MMQEPKKFMLKLPVQKLDILIFMVWILLLKKSLLAANKTNDEICEYIGAKSLDFLSLEGVV